jgi:hypothetical protein
MVIPDSSSRSIKDFCSSDLSFVDPLFVFFKPKIILFASSSAQQRRLGESSVHLIFINRIYQFIIF